MSEHKFYLDTEFIEYTNKKSDEPLLSLVSVGLVDETGSAIYRINNQAKFRLARPWVREHVLKPMGIEVCKVIDYEPEWVSLDSLHPENPFGWAGAKREEGNWRKYKNIGRDILEFVNICRRNKPPVFYTYYGAYDWVLFCRLFGTMMDLPEGFPMYTRDLKQMADEMGIDPQTAIPESGYHNALYDALWNKQLHEYITTKYETVHRRIFA